nr:immunoglobulin light chain junction region [Macaca mulatta]
DYYCCSTHNSGNHWVF